jgi:dihydrolipoamide dehydrogenase
MTEFDLAVIGAGPGGYVAAIRAAQQGACVCVIEQERVGGTCLNRGCIPTKALYSTALLRHRLNAAGDHGFQFGQVSFDYARAAARKDEVVAKLVGGVEQLLKGNKVEVFRGRAVIEGPGRIAIRSQGVIGHVRARRIIVASGSRSARPDSLAIDGKNILTSREILAIKELPGRLLIVGGGYIGCEFAGIFAALGSRVTIVEQLPEILATSDRQVVREIEKSFRELGVEIRTGTAVEGVETVGSEVRVTLAGGDTLTVDKVLVAVGRVPNSAEMGLEECGVTLERGAVVVDDRMQTAAEGIYAIGDVTNLIQLAHVASYQAGIAVTNALGGEARADYRVVPSAIFTLPEIGQVGLTETACKEQGLAIAVGRFSYQASSKALCDGEPRGMFKLVTDAESGRILGAAATGEEASSLIAEVALAMQHDLSANELADVIHAHPTLPEIVKEAAEDSVGRAVHKIGARSRRAGSKD